MSLVPSQDKVLVALNPSALIKTRFIAHTEKLVLHSHMCAHSHTHACMYRLMQSLTITC